MPYFVNSTSLVSKSVIRRYIGVKFRVKVNLGQSSCYFDLRSNFQLDLPRSFRCVLKIPLSLLVRKFFCEKQFILKSLSFLLWPDLEGSRYDLKRSTRVPLDVEYPKDLFGRCPTVLYQLEAKWHGGLQPPPMCVLGWGNNMCGRGLNTPYLKYSCSNS